MEMMQKLSMFDIHVDRFLTMREGNEVIYEVTLYVRNIEYLEKVFRELEKLSYVTKVERLVR